MGSYYSIEAWELGRQECEERYGHCFVEDESRLGDCDCEMEIGEIDTEKYIDIHKSRYCKHCGLRQKLYRTVKGVAHLTIKKPSQWETNLVINNRNT